MIGLNALWASGVREYCCWVIIDEGSFRVTWTGVQSQGREDPQEEGMAKYSSILAWRIP